MRSHDSLSRRWLVATVAPVAIVLAPLPVGPAAGAELSGWSYVRTGLEPMASARTWVLQGEKLQNGSCRYRYATGPTEIPIDGWVVRSIALDPARCRKLMQEGSPTFLKADAPSVTSIFETVSAHKAGDGAYRTASTQGAWQRVVWKDVAGLLVNADLTQINWTYNGSTVSGGSTTGGWFWNTATQWQLGAHGASDLHGSGSSYYRGHTVAVFMQLVLLQSTPYGLHLLLPQSGLGSSERDRDTIAVERLHRRVRSAALRHRISVRAVELTSCESGTNRDARFWRVSSSGWEPASWPAY